MSVSRIELPRAFVSEADPSYTWWVGSLGSETVDARLAQVRPDELIYVDNRGRARSPTWSKVAFFLYWGVVGTLVAVEASLAEALLGWPGLGLGLALAAFAGWNFLARARIREGGRRLSGRDLLGASALYERVVQMALVPGHVRARALLGQAAIARLRGEARLALNLTERALGLWPRVFSGHIIRHGAELSRCQLLAALGKVREADSTFRALPRTAQGDVARLAEYTTELYIAFHRGSHRLSDEVLHQRAKFALQITTAAPLLALLAWAFELRGDSEMASLLRGEARDRHPGRWLCGAMPVLDGWLKGRAPPIPRVRVAGVQRQRQDRAAAEAALEKRARPLRALR